MGFLRRLFGGKKHRNAPPGPKNGSGHKPGKDHRSRSFAKQSTREKSNNSFSTLNHQFDPSTSSAPFTDSLDANKHAVAVAAATAAVAEAALAAAHAAAEVVRLASGSSGVTTATGRPARVRHIQRRLAEETAAAVRIQSAFRGYLARRALRALKALVKLQALVRGHIVRKQTSDMLRRMQTLVRLQSRARASRVNFSDHTTHPFKSSHSHYPRCNSNANFRDIDIDRARLGSTWLDSWMEENAWSQTRDSSMKNIVHHHDDEKSDKILEVDTWKPHLNSTSYHPPHHHYYNFSPSKHSSSRALNTSSLSSREVLPLGSMKFHRRKEEIASRTAENSPQAFSASSRVGSSGRRDPFTPTKSESSWSFFNGYSGYPNYMANTESSKAKVRSQSVPRQRIEFERYGSRKSLHGVWEVRSNLDRDRDYSDFRNKDYSSTTSSSNRKELP